MIGNNVTPFLDELTANESAKSQNPTQRILWPWTKFDHIKIRKTHPSTCLDFQKISPKEECLCTEYIYMKYMFHPSLLGPSEGEWRGDVCLKDYISVLLLA
jgi:hypothetical protein